MAPAVSFQLTHKMVFALSIFALEAMLNYFVYLLLDRKTIDVEKSKIDAKKPDNNFATPSQLD